MKARNARRIRQGLAAAAMAECFRDYATFDRAVQFHRRRMRTVAALKAFEYAHYRANWRARQAAYERFLEGIWTEVQFAGIINHNFQEQS